VEVVGGGGEGASDLVNVNACRLEGGGRKQRQMRD